MIKYHFLILVILALSCIGSSQNSNATKRFRKDFIENENFGIRNRPITNREYLIFICWNISVYGESFPDKVTSLIPGKVESDQYAIIGYEGLLRSSGSVLKNYILNPQYIDYPVTGLSLNQVIALQKWLSDRYNENLLLRLGYLNFTPNQRNSDCFTLESYLAGQYTGSTKNDKIIHWNEYKFIATFRLPDQRELEFLTLHVNDQNKIKAYKFEQNDFLMLWNNQFISEDKHGITLQVGNILNIHLQKGMDSEVMNWIDQNDPEARLNHKEDLFINFDYFDSTKFGEKDKFGKMSFVIIGENDSDRAIIANYNLDGHEQPFHNKMYRIAYNRIIDFKY